MRVKVTSILVGLVASAAILFASAPAAHAAGCFGHGCDGQDPQQMGCSADAITWPDEFTFGDTRIELRYSANCYAAWTRSTGGWHCCDFAHIRGWDSSFGGTLIKDYWAQLNGTNWTSMVSFTYWVQSCVGNDAFGSAYDGQCTGRH